MQPRTESEGDEALAKALEDYHRRRVLGERVALADYARDLGHQYAEFLDVVRAEEALDQAMVEPDEGPALPMPFGPFTLVRKVGSGGMGVVYEAVERSLGRTLALKILRTNFDTDTVARERFRNEARLCATVRHDNIVPIYAAGEIDGSPYYTMDLVPGVPLSDLIADGKVPAPQDLARAMAQVARALHVLHETGVVHRDVKPPNLIVRPDGRMILADFGLARSAESVRVTRSGQAVGTPLYSSPEQLLGHQDKVDRRSDVYGMGAVLYEALAGKPVFQTRDYAVLYRMVMSERPQALRSVVASVPADLERIVLMALEKRPDDRYASAADMADDLERFADGREVLGRPVGGAVRLLRGVKRRWKGLAAAAALLAGIGFWWTHRWATLEVIAKEQGALVHVDGALVGPSPVSTSLKPGYHELVVRPAKDDGNTEPYKDAFHLAPGERVRLPVPVLGTKSYATDQQLLRFAVGVEGGGAIPPEVPEEPSGTRGGGIDADGPVTLLLPYGNVRIQDVVDWVIEVDPENFEPGSQLELWRGKERLWGEVLNLKGNLARGRFPSDVVARLAPGDELELRCVHPAYPAGALAHRTATIVKPDALVKLEPLLKRIDEQYGPAPFHLRQHLRTIELERAGLLSAAFREALGIVLADPADRRGWGSLLRLLDAIELGVGGPSAGDRLSELALDIGNHLRRGKPAPDVSSLSGR